MLPPRPALLFMLEPPPLPPPPLAPPPLPRPPARPPLPPHGPPRARRSGGVFKQPRQTERGVQTLGGVRGFPTVPSLLFTPRLRPRPQAPPSASSPLPSAADPQLQPRFRDARPFRRPRRPRGTRAAEVAQRGAAPPPPRAAGLATSGRGSAGPPKLLCAPRHSPPLRGCTGPRRPRSSPAPLSEVECVSPAIQVVVGPGMPPIAAGKPSRVRDAAPLRMEKSRF